MRPLVAESASAPAVYASVLVVTDPGATPEDVASAIAEAAEKAKARFRPAAPPADYVYQLTLPYDRHYNAQPLIQSGT